MTPDTICSSGIIKKHNIYIYYRGNQRLESKGLLSHDEAKPSSEESEPPGRMPDFAGMKRAESSVQQSSRSHVVFFNRPEKPRHAVQSTPRSFIISPRSRAFYKRFFPGITSAEWNDWQWQLCNRITDIKGLSRHIALSDRESKAFAHHGGMLPVSITPYYAGLLDGFDESQELRRTVVPVHDEFLRTPGESVDPLCEEADSPVPDIVHRYPDRVLFLVTGFCATNCRYCTRSRITGNDNNDSIMQESWDQALSYIASTPAVRDVLLSGGDPLTLPDESLEWLLERLRRIPHVEFIRIGTKVPVVLPQRITPTLLRVLKRFHPLWMSIHFTHPDELTPEVSQACNRLADAGIPLGSQTVLLSGVNDSVATMKALMHGLLRNRVRPYYLYQCDPIYGSAHFRTPVEKGLEIIRGLRGYTTGYAVPTFVIDAPGGGGKVPLLPDYVAGRDGDYVVIRNYAGDSYQYPDPDGTIGL